MSTQHPDNVNLPFFTHDNELAGEDEVQEAYYVFSHLSCDEQMWDCEGKEVDNYVVKKLLTKYEHFFKPGNFLFLRLLIREGYTNRDNGSTSEARIQFNEVKLLQDVMEQQSKKLTLHLKASDIDGAKIQQIEKIIKSFKGKKPITFAVHDDALSVQLKSRKDQISICTELLEILDHENIPYAVNA